MKYISICSGIEAATVAWRPLGWEAVAFAEIEPFPNAVLAHHYPGIPNLGDITKVDWRKYAGAVDLVVGGTPCQSFSVAGKREGLDGASGLVQEYFRLLEEVQPRWFVWENVPGCLSSGRGNDFAFILWQWHELGYHVAWRVLDAQFFGVPQRRRRVFAVGHLGGWQYPAAVLFEPESLRGDITPGRKAGKENPGSVARGTRTASHWDGGPHPSLTQARKGSGGIGMSDQELFSQGGAGLVAKCLTSSNQRLDWETETLVLNDQGGKRMDMRENVAVAYGVITKGNGDVFLSEERHTAISAGGGMPGQGYPAVFCIAGNTIDRQIQNGGNGAGFQPEISYTLNTIDRHAVMCAPVAPTIGASGPQYSRPGNERVKTETLVIQESGGVYASTQEGNAPAVLRILREKVGEEAFAQWGFGILDSLQSQEVLQQALHGIGIRRASREAGVWLDDGSLSCKEGLLTGALRSLWQDGPDGCSSQGRELAQQLAREFGATLPFVPHQDTSFQCVRRLTPLEAERLQGFPDGYTDIEFKGKPAPDGARYKALGNSMAVPCMAWIGKRIQTMEDIVWSKQETT